ncbi:MAG: hypothetical protein ACRCWW_13370 [Scandinavium sp.]|uniref:hypothetical protein n=1 Tax=Scandinavium sp. TaxID=2830653 RepID=UPI003F3BA21E
MSSITTRQKNEIQSTDVVAGATIAAQQDQSVAASEVYKSISTPSANSLKSLHSTNYDLTADDFTHHATENLLYRDGYKQIVINGNSGDTVTVHDYQLELVSTVTIEGTQYDLYRHEGSQSELLLEHGVELNLVYDNPHHYDLTARDFAQDGIENQLYRDGYEQIVINGNAGDTVTVHDYDLSFTTTLTVDGTLYDLYRHEGSKSELLLEHGMVLEQVYDNPHTYDLTADNFAHDGVENQLFRDGYDQIVINGNAGDTVNVHDYDLDFTSTITVEGEQYDLYRHEGSHSELLIEHGVNLNQVYDNPHVYDLDAKDFATQGQEDAVFHDGYEQLVINGNRGDTVNVHDYSLDMAGSVTAGGVQYDVYRHEGSHSELLLQHGVELHQL